MNVTKFWSMVAVATLLLIGGLATDSLAQERAGDARQFFVGSLGAAPATDVYIVGCPVGTSTATADVNENPSVIDAIKLFVCVVNPLGRAQCRAPSSEGGISLRASVAGGAGNYLVVIGRTPPAVGAGVVEAYDTIIECRNAVGTALGTDFVSLVQNQ